jgi:hypothetical protein
MTDPTELAALKASLRGARATAATLDDLAPRVDPLTDDPDDALLEDLRRLSAAHALAAQALRGLVETMLRRRGKTVESVASTGGSGEDE